MKEEGIMWRRFNTFVLPAAMASTHLIPVLFGAIALWLGAGWRPGHWEPLLVWKLFAVLLAIAAINQLRSTLPEVDSGRYEGPALLNPEGRIAQECVFETSDGTKLFYRYWPALGGSAKQAIILFHRGHEHSGRFQHVVEELELPNFAMFAWDARGHGRSPLPKGSSPSLGTLIKDVDTFVRHVSSTYGVPFENIAILGQSVGSVLAAAWAHDYAPKVRCMVLAAPAFKIKLYRLIGEFQVNSYVKPRALTHDPERIASYKADPLITRPISVRALLGLYSTSERIVADAEAIQVPTQLLIPESDWVVHLGPQFEFFERLGTLVKEKHLFEGFYHDVLGERDRYLVMEKARKFILRMFAWPCQTMPLLDSDQGGYTKAEFDELSRPLPLFSRKRLRYALIKRGMKAVGHLSDGIRLGLETGFDSGSTLDYVYRNQASGSTPIGRLIDWVYINSVGWQGIRVRKENIVHALLQSMAMLRNKGLEVRILDIAAGQGRYVLEALERDQVEADEVLLRDLSEMNVRMGWALVKEKKMDGTVRFEIGDAFDRASIATIWPRPTLGVVSGLYELFPDNQPVRESLAGLADAIVPGGLLVYTGQPFHPQLEMIARTLPSHRDFRPWIMRRRTQAEMDQLVEAAGFRKIDQWIDDWGIFTVSIAQRIGA
jgi:alpha-beta hydrolase superfamily lysophospholipase